MTIRNTALCNTIRRAAVAAALALAIALAAAGSGAQALAQGFPAPSFPGPSIPAPASPSDGRAATTPVPPLAPPTPGRESNATTGPRDSGTLSLYATLGGQSGLVRSGLIWRLYKETGDEPQLVQEVEQPAPTFSVEPGVYVVHVTFGLASATKRIVMGPTAISESLVINAGALVLGGVIGDSPIPADRLKFNVYVPIGNDPEARVVISDVSGGRLIRLPEGTYRIVSTYGDSNAISNADLKVESGRVTEATLRHRAATVTLKLVNTLGAEALANTSFSVLTPGGDTIREAIGAFPSMTLAEGDYVVIARNGGKVYTQEFKVKSGFDRDIEVLVK
jgi:hypothetical protein